jgi:hypothetical protein
MRIWSNKNSQMLLVGVKNGIVTLEENRAQKKTFTPGYIRVRLQNAEKRVERVLRLKI